MHGKILASAIALSAASVLPVRAQQCGGVDVVGSLGVSLIECDCTIAPAHTRTEWQFRTEPRIRRIEAGSAAAGLLQVDDVIYSVNGRRITTPEGARELAQLRPNEAVTLMVLREGVLRTEVLRSTSVCANDPTLLGAAPAVQRVRVAGGMEARPATSIARTQAGGAGGARGGGGAAATAQAAARGGSGGAVAGAVPRSGTVTAQGAAPAYAAPRAWIGIAFSCRDCTYRTSRGDREGGEWTFASWPEVYSVETGSPAYEAGIRRGDLVTHINDVQLTTDDGGRRWAQIRPGEQVRLRYVRSGVMRTATLEAAPPRGFTAQRSSAQLREIESALTRVDTANYQQMERNARMIQESYARLRSQQARDAEQEEQLAALIRTNRTHAARLMATQDSIERALATLRALQATTTTGEQRLRYSGTFNSTDIEVRGVSPVIVSETASEITIRIGDAVVTLKRSRD